MMSMHIESMNSVVRYHQDRLAESMIASREGVLSPAVRKSIGIALIRVGEWLRRDALPERAAPTLPKARMRPANAC